MFAIIRRTVFGVGAITCFIPAISACAGSSGADSKAVTAGERTVADTSKTLSAQSVGAIYGFYNAHCTNPGFPGWTSGTAAGPSWSIVATSGFTLPGGAPPAMLLLEGDSASCKLVLTDVILTDDTDLRIAGGAGLPMNNDGTYQATAAQLLGAGDAVIAYINATADQPGVPFATDFNVDLDISDTVGTASASGTAQAAVSSTGFPNISGVLAPDYTANVTVGDLLTNTSNVVISDDTGSVSLAFGTQMGTSSQIMTGDLSGDTFAQIDAAYAMGTPVVFDATGWGPNGECGTGTYTACPSFALDQFLTVGTTTLPATYTLVVQYVDPHGVYSYQAIKLSFSAS
jgi:hypothetical protein